MKEDLLCAVDSAWAQGSFRHAHAHAHIHALRSTVEGEGMGMYMHMPIPMHRTYSTAHPTAVQIRSPT